MKASRRTPPVAATPAGRPTGEDLREARNHERVERIEEMLERSKQAIVAGDAVEGLRFAGKGLRLAERWGDGKWLINSLFACHRAALMLERRSEEIGYLERIVSLVPSVESPDFRSRTLQRAAGLYRLRGSPQLGLELIDAALALSGVNDLRVTAKAFEMRHSILTDFRRYDEAFEAAYRALELRRESGDTLAVAESYAAIGALHCLLEDYVTGEPYCREAYGLGRTAKEQRVRLYVMEVLSACLLGLKKYQEAILIYKETLRALASGWNPSASARVFNNIGVLYMELGNTRKALAWLERALKIGRTLGSPMVVAGAWGGIGQVRQRCGDFSGAFTAYFNALKIAEEDDVGRQGLRAHQYLSEIYSLVGDYRQSLDHLKEAASRREVLLKARASVSEAVRKRTEITDERERRELHAELDQARREAESKTKELNTVLLRLGRRDKVLKSLMRIVEPASRPGSDETKALARKIVSEISSALDDHAEYRMFEEQFARTPHEYIRRLRARFPGLTPTEIRVCVLLMLDMSTKQIGEALFASELTIKTHRANIRRKMGLGPADNLGAVLMGL